MFTKISSTSIAAPKKTNYIFCADVSGSMSGVLAQLRTQLKNKLTTLIQPGDLLSIIFFSGKNEAGFVFEDFEINSATDLAAVKTGIDRYLTPIGLTAFCKPLTLALTKVNPDYLNGLIFMTDGYNNDCDQSTIFASLGQINNVFDSVTFIEYGYYADTKLISKMATAANGGVITSTEFNDLVLRIESSFQGLQAPKIEVAIPTSYAVGFANDTLTIYFADASGNIYVQGNTEWIVYGTPTTLLEDLATVWATFVLGDIDTCEETLRGFGDVGLYEAFSKAYGKQKANEFKNMVLETIIGIREPYAQGHRHDYAPDPNAYTVMDVLRQLSEGNNYLYAYDPDFNYNRIGRKAIPATIDTELLTDLAAVTGSQSTALSALTDKEVKFVPSAANGAYSIANLGWNTSRANVNLTITIPGEVVNIPENQWGITRWPSQIIRSYNIIKDGILNVTLLPVGLDEKTAQIFTEKGLIGSQKQDDQGRVVYLLNLATLPVINRASLQSLSAVETATAIFELEIQKAAAKAFKYLSKDETEPEVGTDAERDAWLSTIGIKPYGFNPSVTLAESLDFYMAPQLTAKIAGLSSLPAVAATVKKREDNKKLNLADTVLLKQVDTFAALTEVVDDQTKLNELTAKVVAHKRALEVKLANTVMSLILGQKWFTDKAGYEDTHVSFEHPVFGTIEVEFKYDDVAVQI